MSEGYLKEEALIAVIAENPNVSVVERGVGGQYDVMEIDPDSGDVTTLLHYLIEKICKLVSYFQIFFILFQIRMNLRA